jgi:hypothetical protein
MKFKKLHQQLSIVSRQLRRQVQTAYVAALPAIMSIQGYEVFYAVIA